MADKRTQITIRLDPTFHRKLEDAVYHRRTTYQEITEAFYRRWVNEGIPQEQVSEEKAEEKALVSKFLNFVRTADPSQVEIVDMILESHARKQRAARKQRSS